MWEAARLPLTTGEDSFCGIRVGQLFRYSQVLPLGVPPMQVPAGRGHGVQRTRNPPSPSALARARLPDAHPAHRRQ